MRGNYGTNRWMIIKFPMKPAINWQVYHQFQESSKYHIKLAGYIKLFPNSPVAPRFDSKPGPGSAQWSVGPVVHQATHGREAHHARSCGCGRRGPRVSAGPWCFGQSSTVDFFRGFLMFFFFFFWGGVRNDENAGELLDFQRPSHQFPLQI